MASGASPSVNKRWMNLKLAAAEGLLANHVETRTDVMDTLQRLPRSVRRQKLSELLRWAVRYYPHGKCVCEGLKGVEKDKPTSSTPGIEPDYSEAKTSTPGVQNDDSEAKASTPGVAEGSTSSMREATPEDGDQTPEHPDDASPSPGNTPGVTNGTPSVTDSTDTLGVADEASNVQSATPGVEDDSASVAENRSEMSVRSSFEGSPKEMDSEFGFEDEDEMEVEGDVDVEDGGVRCRCCGTPVTGECCCDADAASALEFLVRLGADVCAFAGTAGGTPLHVAAEGGSEIQVKTLLALGADLYAKDLGGMLALHRAAQRGHTGVVVIMLNWARLLSLLEDSARMFNIGIEREKYEQEKSLIMFKRKVTLHQKRKTPRSPSGIGSVAANMPSNMQFSPTGRDDFPNSAVTPHLTDTPELPSPDFQHGNTDGVEISPSASNGGAGNSIPPRSQGRSSNASTINGGDSPTSQPGNQFGLDSEGSAAALSHSFSDNRNNSTASSVWTEASQPMTARMVQQIKERGNSQVFFECAARMAAESLHFGPSFTKAYVVIAAALWKQVSGELSRLDRKVTMMGRTPRLDLGHRKTLDDEKRELLLESLQYAKRQLIHAVEKEDIQNVATGLGYYVLRTGFGTARQPLSHVSGFTDPLIVNKMARHLEYLCQRHEVARVQIMFTKEWSREELEPVEKAFQSHMANAFMGSSLREGMSSPWLTVSLKPVKRRGGTAASTAPYMSPRMARKYSTRPGPSRFARWEFVAYAIPAQITFHLSRADLQERVQEFARQFLDIDRSINDTSPAEGPVIFVRQKEFLIKASEIPQHRVVTAKPQKVYNAYKNGRELEVLHPGELTGPVWEIKTVSSGLTKETWLRIDEKPLQEAGKSRWILQSKGLSSYLKPVKHVFWRDSRQLCDAAKTFFSSKSLDSKPAGKRTKWAVEFTDKHNLEVPLYVALKHEMGDDEVPTEEQNQPVEVLFYKVKDHGSNDGKKYVHNFDERRPDKPSNIHNHVEKDCGCSGRPCPYREAWRYMFLCHHARDVVNLFGVRVMPMTWRAPNKAPTSNRKFFRRLGQLWNSNGKRDRRTAILVKQAKKRTLERLRSFVETQDYFGSTSLTLAAWKQQTDVVNLLVNLGYPTGKPPPVVATPKPTGESKYEDFDDDSIMCTPTHDPHSIMMSTDLSAIDPYDPDEPEKPDQYPSWRWTFEKSLSVRKMPPVDGDWKYIGSDINNHYWKHRPAPRELEELIEGDLVQVVGGDRCLGCIGTISHVDDHTFTLLFEHERIQASLNSSLHKLIKYDDPLRQFRHEHVARFEYKSFRVSVHKHPLRVGRVVPTVGSSPRLYEASDGPGAPQIKWACNFCKSTDTPFDDRWSCPHRHKRTGKLTCNYHLCADCMDKAAAATSPLHTACYNTFHSREVWGDEFDFATAFHEWLQERDSYGNEFRGELEKLKKQSLLEYSETKQTQIRVRLRWKRVFIRILILGILNDLVVSATRNVTNLIMLKADINSSDLGGQTVLQRVSRSRRIAMLHKFVNEGADVDAKDAQDRTALYWAVTNSSTEPVTHFARDLICRYGAKTRSNLGTPLLMVAVRRYADDDAIIKLLFDHGALLAEDKDVVTNQTALHVAATYHPHKVELLKLLLTEGYRDPHYEEVHTPASKFSSFRSYTDPDKERERVLYLRDGLGDSAIDMYRNACIKTTNGTIARTEKFLDWFLDKMKAKSRRDRQNEAETAREMSSYTDPETGIRTEAPRQLILRMHSVPAYDTLQAYGASFTLRNTSATHVLVVYALEIRCNSDRGDEDEDVDPIAKAQDCTVLVSPAQWLAGHVLGRHKELDGEERVDVQLTGTKEQVSLGDVPAALLRPVFEQAKIRVIAWPYANDADTLPSRAFLGKIGKVKRFDAISSKWKVELETSVEEAREAIDQSAQGYPGVAYAAHKLKMSLGYGPKAVVWLVDQQMEVLSEWTDHLPSRHSSAKAVTKPVNTAPKAEDVHETLGDADATGDDDQGDSVVSGQDHGNSNEGDGNDDVDDSTHTDDDGGDGDGNNDDVCNGADDGGDGDDADGDGDGGGGGDGSSAASSNNASDADLASVPNSVASSARSGDHDGTENASVYDVGSASVYAGSGGSIASGGDAGNDNYEEEDTASDVKKGRGCGFFSSLFGKKRSRPKTVKVQQPTPDTKSSKSKPRSRPHYRRHEKMGSRINKSRAESQGVMRHIMIHKAGPSPRASGQWQELLFCRYRQLPDHHGARVRVNFQNSGKWMLGKILAYDNDSGERRYKIHYDANESNIKFESGVPQSRIEFLEPRSRRLRTPIVIPPRGCRGLYAHSFGGPIELTSTPWVCDQRWESLPPNLTNVLRVEPGWPCISRTPLAVMGDSWRVCPMGGLACRLIPYQVLTLDSSQS